MKKSFVDWPLDGQIFFVLTILAIFSLFLALFFDRKNNYIAKKSGDFFEMKLLNSARVFLVVMLLLCIFITYGVLQSGHCNLMTLTENTKNQLMGIVVAAGFWIALLFFGYVSFFKKYYFNGEQIKIVTPFSKKIFMLSDLSGAGYDWQGGYFYFGKKNIFRVPSWVVGMPQLYNAIMIANSNKIHSEQGNISKDVLEKNFLGKRVIYIKYDVDGNYIKHPSGFELGKIYDISNSNVGLLMDNGKNILLNNNSLNVGVFDKRYKPPKECRNDINKILESGCLPEIIIEHYAEKK